MPAARLIFQSSHVDRVDGTLIRETNKRERMAADFLTENKFDHLDRPNFASKIHTIFETSCADDYYQQTFRDAFWSSRRGTTRSWRALLLSIATRRAIVLHSDGVVSAQGGKAALEKVVPRDRHLGLHDAIDALRSLSGLRAPCRWQSRFAGVLKPSAYGHGPHAFCGKHPPSHVTERGNSPRLPACLQQPISRGCDLRNYEINSANFKNSITRPRCSGK
jgi:hypothetical protein